MRTRTASIALILLAAVPSSPAAAQAVLGRAISGAMAKEAQTIRDAEHRSAHEGAPASVKPSAPVAHHQAGHTAGKAHAVEAPLGTGDALANTDAITCQQANGTTIHVSGGYRPAAGDSGECH